MATIDKQIVRKAFRASTNPLRVMPDFFIIGAQKGGTTSLYQYLIEHPNIAPIYVKEPHFFDIYYHKGIGWYRSHFPTAAAKYYSRHIQKQDLITGEASPYYLIHPLVPTRIAKTLPRAKLIVLLRNPIDRAYSHYQDQKIQSGVELLSFEEAIEREETRLAGEEEKLIQDEKYISYNHRHYSYLARSAYINQLPRWMSLFPKEQLLILKSEDLFTNSPAIVQQALHFLNLPPLEQNIEYRPFNKASYPPMHPATRERLIEHFKPLNARLYDYLGRDFGWDQ
jgi:hypothetical protein